MKVSFLDANIFIRSLTNDDPINADRVERLLGLAARGKERLMTTEMVVAEVVRVLESFYKLRSTTIGPMVKAILATSGLEIEQYMEQNIDFIDGYIVAVMDRHHVTEIFSYDKKHLTPMK